MVSLVVVAVFFLWGALFQPLQTAAFKPLFSAGSLTHREITEMAILRKTAEVCHDIAVAHGEDFQLPINNRLKAYSVQKACLKSLATSTALSAHSFHSAVAEIYLSNAAVDLVFILNDVHHMDNEAFREGRSLITQGVAAVKASIKQGSYISARIRLGALCHTLQDFYSHSNWVEMGNTDPYNNLIRPELPLNNIAGPNTPTCKNCVGQNCRDNILPEILQQKKLTSGYFSLFSSSKPVGKCSHGGAADRTSSRKPTGGINKDTVSSSHGFLHHQAAELAIRATMDLLEDIRLATSNLAFLRLMGISQTSALAFVIDTTGSMYDYISEAKTVSLSIIDSRRGTPEEPSEYILVPFNDPDFGPLLQTGDADIFKQRINSISASGGGDDPEMCLSGLLLALSGAPRFSDIFVFTDAAAKDSELKSTIQALIESTKSTVTFMLANTSASRSRRGVSKFQSSSSRPLSQSEIQLYRDLAHVSGGQAIEVTKTTLSQATTIIKDAFRPSLVTVLQVVRFPAKAENFSFVLDESLSNVTLYITGISPVFTLYSPTGMFQSHSVADGPLGSIQTVGNLWRVKLKSGSQVGEWNISINATRFYTLKVIGQSFVVFLFNFVEASEQGHGDFTPKDNRPFIGGNATLFLSVTGGESVTVTEVLLLEASGSGTVSGTIKPLGGTDFLVNMDRIPEGAFVVLLKGLLIDTSRFLFSQFQRQSPTQQRGSRITIMAQPQSTIQPGIPFSFNFTVATNTTGGSYTIRAKTDRDFSVSAPKSLDLESGGSAQGTMTLTAPPNTESGTDVTLTIEAEAPGSTDFNYATLRLTVMPEVTDFSRPVCQVVSINADCPVDCSTASWELSANVMDGSGTDIVGVSLNRGNGSLSISNVMNEVGRNVTVASYNASCCFPEVELVAVDMVGNVRTCFASVKSLSACAAASGWYSVSFSMCIFVSLIIYGWGK